MSIPIVSSWVFERSSRISPQVSRPIESPFFLSVSMESKWLLQCVVYWCQCRASWGFAVTPRVRLAPFTMGRPVPESQYCFCCHTHISNAFSCQRLQQCFSRAVSVLKRSHARIKDPVGTFCDFDTCKCCEMRTNPLLSVTKQLLRSFFFPSLCLYVQQSWQK